MSISVRAEKGELAGLALAAGAAIFSAVFMLGSRSALLLVAAPIGAIGLVIAARRPLFALSIMVVIEFANLSGLFATKTGIPIFAPSLLMGLVAIGFALRDPECRSRINGWTVLCAGLLGVYLATGAIATIGSVDIAASMAAMQRNAVDCVFVMVVLVLVQMTARPWMVAAVIVLTLASLCTLTIISWVGYGGNETFGGLSTVTTASGEMITTLRYGGPLPDSNFWGRHLALGLPMAAALMTRALRGDRRATAAAWGIALMLLLGGVYLTQSRGSFLAAGVAIAVWFLAVERSVRRWALILVPSGAALFAVPGVGNRIVAAFEDFTQADVANNIDPSVVGRLAAQEEAWMMFDQRPYFGFGPGTFPGQVINFAGRVMTAAREPTDAPHNLYAELAAETGVLGVLGWAVVILGFLSVVLLGIIANPLSRDRILAAAVCAAIVAWSAASIALHMAYFRTFGVVLALAAGLAPAWPAPADAVRGLIRGAAVWCAAGLIGTGVFWVCLTATTSEAMTARQQMTLTPVGFIDGSYAYALDIRSRIELLPTFATVLEEPPVQVFADPVRGTLTFTSTADTFERARDEIQLAVAGAGSKLHNAIGYDMYFLQPVGSMRVEPTRQRSPIDTVIAVGIGAGAALIAGAGLQRAANRRRTTGRVDHATTREATFVSP